MRKLRMDKMMMAGSNKQANAYDFTMWKPGAKGQTLQSKFLKNNRSFWCGMNLDLRHPNSEQTLLRTAVFSRPNLVVANLVSNGGDLTGFLAQDRFSSSCRQQLTVAVLWHEKRSSVLTTKSVEGQTIT
jgi:hypothetical protein